MTRFVKTIGIFLSLLLTLSLLGCASDHDSSKKAEKEVKHVETAAKPKADNTKAVETVQPKTEEKPTTVTQVPANQEKQPSTKSSSQTQTNTGSTAKTSKVNTTTAPKPAATTSNTTTKTVSPPKTQLPATTVTLSIVGPKDRGTIIGASAVSFNTGDTIYDVLLKAAKKHDIVVDANGSGATTYVQGIDNIYEFDYGAKSGWIFKLNGASLTKSIGAINVKDGDRIECYYTE